MADITKCHGTNNAKCNRCYRKSAPSNDNYQSYFISPPMVDGKCAEYWDDAEWQSPTRAKAIAQNGNVGYSERDVLG